MTRIKMAGFMIAALALLSVGVVSLAPRTGDDPGALSCGDHARPDPDLQVVLQASRGDDLPRRAAALVRWREARGALPADDAEAGAAYLALAGTAKEAVAAAPADDRVFEAALYTAWRLRRDRVGLFGALVGNMLAAHLIETRPSAPAFAARYAPSDVEVARVVASEGVWIERRAAAIYDRDVDFVTRVAVAVAVVTARRMSAVAPGGRHGPSRHQLRTFVEDLVGHAPTSLTTHLGRHVRELHDGVDRYHAWIRMPLGSAPPRRGPT